MGVTVRMRPVCDCGYVFEHIRCTPEEPAFVDRTLRIIPWRTEPAFCPGCNQLIQSITSQSPSDYGFYFDESQYNKEA